MPWTTSIPSILEAESWKPVNLLRSGSECRIPILKALLPWKHRHHQELYQTGFGQEAEPLWVLREMHVLWGLGRTDLWTELGKRRSRWGIRGPEIEPPPGNLRSQCVQGLREPLPLRVPRQPPEVSLGPRGSAGPASSTWAQS